MKNFGDDGRYDQLLLVSTGSVLVQPVIDLPKAPIRVRVVSVDHVFWASSAGEAKYAITTQYGF